MARSRYFRLSFVAFVRTTVVMVAKACVVMPVPVRKPHPDSFGISISWV